MCLCIYLYIYFHTLTDIGIYIGASLKKTLVKQRISLAYISPSKSVSSPVPSLLMSAGVNQFLLRLGAALYTGDAQRELSQKPYGFNLLTAMIS